MSQHDHTKEESGPRTARLSAAFPSFKPSDALLLVLAIASAGFIASYLPIEPMVAAWVVVAILLALAICSLRLAGGIGALRTCEKVSLACFSALFSLSLVLGEHIRITVSGYIGLVGENYIEPYTPLDVVAFVFMAFGIFLLSAGLFCAIAKLRAQGTAVDRPHKHLIYKPIHPGGILIVAAILFACWTPWLICYWPGFVFGDTIQSLMQIFGDASASDHHPYGYTMFIGACLSIGEAVGIGHTGGCAIYSVCQMAFMAICLAYLIRWIQVRLGLRSWISCVLVVVFGPNPYVATFSIAMWKDPIFSAALVVITVMLFDFVLSKGRAVRSVRWTLAFAVMLLAAAFTRNNGRYILLLMLVIFLAVLVITCLRSSRRRFFHRVDLGRASGILAFCLTVCLVVTGPIYWLLGVTPTETVEGVGLMFNQMARVAATDGHMTTSDEEYMDSVLPLELYPECYRPCCIDNLKWDYRFNSEPLETDFFAHWTSMLSQNLGTYIEAWELETFGFWTVNEPSIYERDGIAAGAPRNDPEVYAAYPDEVDKYGIDVSAGFADDIWHDIFPSYGPSVPGGVVFWLVAYLCVVLCLTGKRRWLFAVLPTIGLMLTVVVASPIWYLPRYIAAAQFLIPFYLALFVLCTWSTGEGRRRHRMRAGSAGARGQGYPQGVFHQEGYGPDAYGQAAYGAALPAPPAVFQEDLSRDEVVEHDQEGGDELAEPSAGAQERDARPQQDLVDPEADEA